MSIVVVGGEPRSRGTGWVARETLNPSTSTTPQTVALDAPLTRLSTATGGTGTATGFEINVFALSTASAVETMAKTILMTGTGEAKVLVTNGTATGRWVLNAADDCMAFVYLNDKWRVIFNSGATLATST